MGYQNRMKWMQNLELFNTYHYALSPNLGHFLYHLARRTALLQLGIGGKIH